MPIPTAGDVHVNRILTQLSIRYGQQNLGVADRVFPRVNVMKQSDKYFIYDLADWNRPAMQMRAPGTESAGSGWRVSTDTYFTDIWALHKDIDDPTRANADAPLDMDMDAIAYLNQQASMRRDIQFATDFFKTGVWTGSTTGTDISVGAQWSTTSTPITDIKAQARSVKDRTGFKPNVLLINGNVWDALSENAQITGKIQYSERAIVTKAMVAEMLELDEIIVADNMKVTSNEGASSTTTTEIFGKHALLMYVPKRVSLNAPAAGYSFMWSGLMGAGDGQRIKSFRMEHLESDRIEIQTAFDQKQTGPLLGAFFSSVVA